MAMRSTSSGSCDDQVALEAEHHEDREQQGDERERADARDELLLVPLAALGLERDEAGEHAGEERDAEVDEDALGDLADGDVDRRALEPEQRRQLGDEDPGVDAVEEHLEDAVEGDEARGVLGVPSASWFQTITMAMQRARPIMISPTMYSG